MPPARLEIRLRCSVGTYVRSLARDWAPPWVPSPTWMRCGGRLPVPSPWPTLTLATIEETAARGDIAAMLLPTGARLGLPVLRLDAETATRVGHGQQVALDSEPSGTTGDGQAWSAGSLAAAQNHDGEFLGVMRCLHRQDEGRWVWKAEKWLA
ncbi:MAG: hypothetical protein R2838_20305 [Caldilineaceae bacterium]